jgi:HSP20 family protein
MTLLRFHPGRELLDIQDQVNRLFEGTLPLHPLANGSSWLPAVDVHETESGFTLRMDLPGIQPENVRVRMIDSTLTIEGERKAEESKGRPHRVERMAGSFSRSFTLKTPVDAAAIRAAYRDGVLEVTVPRAEEALPREIKIETA